MSLKNFLKKNYNFYLEKKKSRGNLLFIDRERVDNLFQLSILSLAISDKYNLNTIILTDQKDNSLVVKMYKKLGFKNFLSGFSKMTFFSNSIIFFFTSIHFVSSTIKLKFFGFDWFINKFNVNGIFFGDLIYDSNIRYHHRFVKPKIDLFFLKLHFISIFRFFLIKNYLKKLNIKKILIGTENGSNNNGLALRISSKMNITNYSYYRMSKNGVSIKSISKDYYLKGIDYITKTNFTEFSKKISFNKIEKFYSDRKKFKTINWYTMNDYKRANKISLANNNFLNLLKKQKKKKILFACHAFSDAPHASGKFLFTDYFQHFEETLKYAYNTNNDYIWIFKPHPSSKLYDEKKIFHNLIQKYKKENIYYCPDNLATEKVINICETVITGRGTIGIESLCLGKKVITAGSSPYSGLGITNEPKTKKNYFSLLKNINKPLNLKKINATKYKAKLLLYILENGLHVKTIKIKSLSKDSKYKNYLSKIYKRNFNRNLIFNSFKDILDSHVVNSEIYKELRKII